ncbi:MAG: hypothetical protein ACLUW8_02645 [Subdoligranulum sp.]
MYNLLLVDDEPLIKVAFQSAVEWGKNGFLLAATASNGQEALPCQRRDTLDAGYHLDLENDRRCMDRLALIHGVRKSAALPS